MIQNRVNRDKHQELGYTPAFYRLGNTAQKQALITLLEQQEEIHVYDELDVQLRELVKIHHPTKRLTPEEITALVADKLGDTPTEAYGVWVYYPWARRVVHIVDEAEFIELRTARNMQKITKEERDLLSTKKLAIIGLSVGQSIALTLVMERLCGELRLADFDALELSNMNRIRTGIHNLNIPKVVIAAREIVELDPFIKVTCFNDGATDDNLDDILGGSDLLIEECDGIDIKIISRIKAKAMKLPVVMEMNDRGMLDIERYDLDPEYPMMHGLIPDIDVKTLKNLSNEEKVPILGPMVDMHNMSPRMKQSLAEIGKTITTWPQLASSVVLGGAMVADTVRRILLGQLTASGRYYVDFEQIIK